MGTGTSHARGGGAKVTSTKSGGWDKGKMFSGRPIDEWDYSGDGEEEKKWFKANTNNYDLMDEIAKDKDASDAFHDWASGHFMSGQQYRGFDNMSDYDQELTRELDKWLDRSEVRSTLTVCRSSTPELVLGKGRTTATLAEMQAMQGSVVQSKGCMSTGAAAEGLGIGSKYRKPIDYVITIPGGSKGAGMYIGSKRVNGWGHKQREFITNRDSFFKVGRSWEEGGVIKTELLWDGLGAHDYGKKGTKKRK